ncbi:MAG: 2-C-methyl-D-erythritol 4-phosphate cytidylyltransferase [Elusimicrobia bacterium CG06_land_8_20_14_3_00_38_11]|nr:MAG: 2-C-methyl-D-erythritol 4-phosphate cytidylyltransferase [Elusimicrobia bacterium CG06_land_8_20_14_3_00_38_11]
MKIAAIILAAGKGLRFGSKKQFEFIGKRKVIELTVSKFLKISDIKNIVLVLPKEDIKRKFNFSDRVKIVPGGQTRQHSVFNGLSVLDSDTDIVLIHDGVRPFVSEKIIKNSIISAKKYGASVVAVPSKDTVKICKEGFVISTPERRNIFLAQTPQTFKYSLIMRAYKKAFERKYFSTDDSALVEKLGKKVKIVSGNYKNIKITTKSDLKI